MLKHPQIREVGAFASLPPISQKSEMSSSRRLKSFCKQLYQGQKKTSQGKGDLGGHRRSPLGGAPRKKSFVNGREMGVERLVRTWKDSQRTWGLSPGKPLVF